MGHFIKKDEDGGMGEVQGMEVMALTVMGSHGKALSKDGMCSQACLTTQGTYHHRTLAQKFPGNQASQNSLDLDFKMF